MTKKDKSYRLDKIAETLVNIANLDFTNRLKSSDNLDTIDAISVGLNMLSEELESALTIKNNLLEKQSELYDRSPDMLLSISPQGGTILACNKTLLNKTGYSKKEVIGRPVIEIYHPDCHPKFYVAFKSFQETGVVKNVELQIKKKDDSIIHVLLNVDAQKDENGKVLRSNSSWTDISEIVLLRKELENANKELEQKVRNRTAEKKILNTIIEAQEQIRERISQNLHEGLAQTLAGLGYHIDGVAAKLDDTKNEEIGDSLVFIKKYIDESIKITRTISMDLMPRSLSEQGLTPSIRNHISLSEYPFEIELDSDLNGKNISHDVEITAYRTIIGIFEKATESQSVKNISILLNKTDRLNSIINIQGKYIIRLDPEGNIIDRGYLAAHKRIELQGGNISYIQDKKKKFTTISMRL